MSNLTYKTLPYYYRLAMSFALAIQLIRLLLYTSLQWSANEWHIVFYQLRCI